MKFRSWHIVLTGMALQAAFGLIMLSGIESAPGFGGIILAVGGILVVLASTLGIIPLLLLIFNRTRKLGAVISIIFGLLGIVTSIGLIVGAFMVAASIFYFWKKV